VDNFNNILPVASTQCSFAKKLQKQIVSSTKHFLQKAAQKMLVKLTPGVLRYFQYLTFIICGLKNVLINDFCN
jgi:hypothetical protein